MPSNSSDGTCDSAAVVLDVVLIIIFVAGLLIRKPTTALLCSGVFTRTNLYVFRHVAIVTFIFVTIVVALGDALTFILKEEEIARQLLLLI